MGEPISSTTVTGVATAATLTGWWAGLDSGVVIGAFTGAVFFLTSSKELKLIDRGAYFFVSFIVGVISAPYVSEIISLLIPGTKNTAPVALGALISAAIAIKFLLAISLRDILARLWAGVGGVLAAAAVKQKDSTKDD